MFDNRVYIALDNSPDHAAALGRLLGHWGLLELFLIGLMQHLLSVSPDKAEIVYKEIVSAKAKFLMMKRINHHFTIDKSIKIEIDNVLTAAEKLNNKRNAFIHAVWAGDPNDMVRFENVLPGKYTKIRKDPLPFNPQDIQNVVEEIAKLSASLGNLLFRLFEVPQEQP